MARGRIPREFIQDLIQRADIVDIVGARIALKKGGRDHKACCPFHDEKSPSFTVSQTKQFYHCFGCGAHGNVLDFIMQYDRLDFVDAIESLAGHLGLDIPYEEGDNQPLREKVDYDLLEQVAQQYQNALKQSPKAIEYLKSRGISGITAKHFRLGFVPDQWQSLVNQFTPNQLEQLKRYGLVLDGKRGLYDRFRHRIMFPIRDPRGRVIGFGGRTLGDDPAKYMNSPESPAFHKGEELYGLYEARQANSKLEKLLIVEGYMDVIALAEHGIQYAVATLGTATTAKHIQKLLRSSQMLVFCFDGDEAGRNAAWKALTICLPQMHDGIQAKFLFLPDKEDPDSFIQTHTREQFERLIDQSLSISQFFFKQLKKQVPIHSIDDKAKFTKSAMEYINTVPSGIFKQLLIEQLQDIAGITLEATPNATENTSPPIQSNQLHPLLKHCLSLLLQYPELAQHTDGFPLPEQSVIRQVIDTLKQHPTLSFGQLLTYFTDTKQKQLLTNAATTEFELTPEAAQQEWQQSWQRLQQLSNKQARERLIATSKKRDLTLEEKQTLQRLLQTIS